MKRSWICLFAVGWVGCSHPTPVYEPPMVVRDLRQEVDPEVRWVPVKVPAEKNGWDLMIRATQSVTKALPSGEPQKIDKNLIDPNVTPSASEVAQAEEVIQPYTAAFHLMDQALTRPYWGRTPLRDDIVPDPLAEVSTKFPELAPLKNMARARCLRARLRYAKGDGAGAASDLIATVKMGGRLASSDGSLIHYLIGVSSEKIACDEILILASKPNWTTAQLQGMLNELPDRPNGARLARVLRHEFDLYTVRYVAGMPADPSKYKGLVSKDVADHLVEVLASNPHPLDRRATIREASRVYKDDVLNATRPFSAHVDAEGKMQKMTAIWPNSVSLEPASEGAADKQVPQKDWDTAKANAGNATNPLGRLVMVEPPSIYSQADIAERKSQGMLSGTRVALAAEIYRRRHHAEPPDLKALVRDGILKAVPVDPFTEKALQYSAEQRITWSVGPKPEANDTGDRNGHPTGLVWPTDGIVPKTTGPLK